MKKPTIAFLYDFDRTLSSKDQQEYTFIPSLGLTADEFWSKADDLANKYQMDRILGYMKLMLDESIKKGLPITREAFNELGKKVELLPGVDTWFERINKFGKECGFNVEHYILSSGLKEIMEATPIAKYIKRIFACEYHYDENGNADWPKNLVNYTTKTQFLFRISKGSLELNDDSKVNMEVKTRAVKYENMIYIGDGITDVPCMTLIRDKHGYAIALYHKNKKSKISKLLLDDRVDFACLANYEEGSDLESSVKKIIEKIKIQEELNEKFNQQLKEAKKYEVENND